MSTTPGKHSWEDAGLVPLDDAGLPAADGDDEEELPVALGDDVPEADALEQHLTAAGLPPQPPQQRDDAAEHDVLEQAVDVPLDDEEYPTA